MEQQRALNALEPYLALSKSATSPRAAADLIAQATSAPQTYIFTELLQTSNIQALRTSTEYSSHLRLLEIFSWGTFADYTATPNLPALSNAQSAKLSLLSLLPLCASPTTLNYNTLQERLSVPSDQALEQLVTTAIYANLLQAHLDPQHRTVSVTSVAPLRDLAPNSLPELIKTLEGWETRCGGVLSEIEVQIAQIRSNARSQNLREARKERAFEDAVTKTTLDADKKAANDSSKYGPGAGGNLGKQLLSGLGLGGKGGKRAAPASLDAAESEDVDDWMEVDDGYETQPRGGGLLRRVKR